MTCLLTDRLPRIQLGWAVLVICFGLAMSSMDGLIVNLALPIIARAAYHPGGDHLAMGRGNAMTGLITPWPLVPVVPGVGAGLTLATAPVSRAGF